MRIIELCLDERVDALLLAGDLYDGEQTSMKTARFLAEQLGRLHAAGISAFIIRGNHDAMSKITRELVMPETVTVFTGRADAVRIERGRGEVPVVVHGLSFAQPQAPENLLPKYRPPVEEAVNIGLLHTSLDGRKDHDPYSPCSLAELQRTGFRYWALGHVHRRAGHEGATTVVMAGMPQGRDINEAGPKSATLVTLGDDRSLRVEERLTSVAEFARVTADVTGVEDWRDLVETVARTLDAAMRGTASDHLVARLRVTGATPLAWRLRRDADLLAAELAVRIAPGDGCSVEKIEIECRPSATPTGAVGDPVGELRRLIDEDVLGSEAFRRQVAELADGLRGQLPPECRAILGSDETGSSAILDGLGRDGIETVLARLQAESLGA